MSLGQALKRIRQTRGWSMGTVAYRAQLDKTTIYRLEKGQLKTLTVPPFIRLAKALDMTIQQLATHAGYLPPALAESRPVWELEPLAQSALDLFRQLPNDEQEEMLERLRLEVNLHERRSTDEE